MATVVIATDLGELARDARTIVRGRVAAVDGQWSDDRRTIETLVTLDVENYLKGALGSSVAFRVPGGTMGRLRNVVVGAPEFAVGQRVVVFLAAHGPSVPYVLGLNQGVYRLQAAGRGDWEVTPPPILPTVGPIVRGSESRQPLPLTDFERRVRNLAGGPR